MKNNRFTPKYNTEEETWLLGVLMFFFHQSIKKQSDLKSHQKLNHIST
jgi:hypothetical protein